MCFLRENEMPIKALLLPGLDGTGKLLDDFAQAAPSKMICEIVRYEKHFTTLDDFVTVAALKLRTETKTVVIAESFSGPIATQLASRFPERIAAIVFAASFVEPPYGSLLRLIRAFPKLALNNLISDNLTSDNLTFGNLIFRRWLVKHCCLNGVQDKSLIDKALTVVESLDADVIRRRVALLSRVESVSSSAIPVLDFQATHDRALSRTATTSVAQTFPNATTVKFDAPHFLLLAQPVQCWIEIEKYLANISGSE